MNLKGWEPTSDKELNAYTLFVIQGLNVGEINIFDADASTRSFGTILDEAVSYHSLSGVCREIHQASKSIKF